MVYVHPWVTQSANQLNDTGQLRVRRKRGSVAEDDMGPTNLQRCMGNGDAVPKDCPSLIVVTGKDKVKGLPRHAASSVGLKYLQASRDWSNHNGVWRPFSHRRLGGSRCCPPYDAMIDGMCWSGPIARARTALSALPTAMAFLAQEGNMRGSDSL